ncbi:hypothetical protein MG293_003305 [Ovis ammon polii]|uniref:Uncharacterized protein n=1 Tax=Ovis ammon polii TaxID=230172 RepID=A0AAD4UMJ7_OVIAM|nr:hypothetical protein MG293_003305 [Ovis ammon polii]
MSKGNMVLEETNREHQPTLEVNINVDQQLTIHGDLAMKQSLKTFFNIVENIGLASKRLQLKSSSVLHVAPSFSEVGFGEACSILRPLRVRLYRSEAGPFRLSAPDGPHPRENGGSRGREGTGSRVPHEVRSAGIRAGEAEPER